MAPGVGPSSGVGGTRVQVMEVGTPFMHACVARNEPVASSEHRGPNVPRARSNHDGRCTKTVNAPAPPRSEVRVVSTPLALTLSRSRHATPQCTNAHDCNGHSLCRLRSLCGRSLFAMLRAGQSRRSSVGGRPVQCAVGKTKVPNFAQDGLPQPSRLLIHFRATSARRPSAPPS